MTNELDQARHVAAIELLQFIDAISNHPETDDLTTAALDVVDAIANYSHLTCLPQPQTSSASSAGLPLATLDP